MAQSDEGESASDKTSAPAPAAVDAGVTVPATPLPDEAKKTAGPPAKPGKFGDEAMHVHGN